LTHMTTLEGGARMPVRSSAPVGSVENSNRNPLEIHRVVPLSVHRAYSLWCGLGTALQRGRRTVVRRPGNSADRTVPWERLPGAPTWRPRCSSPNPNRSSRSRWDRQQYPTGRVPGAGELSDLGFFEIFVVNVDTGGITLM
jgi:hypothetical protein